MVSKADLFEKVTFVTLCIPYHMGNFKQRVPTTIHHVVGIEKSHYGLLCGPWPTSVCTSKRLISQPVVYDHDLVAAVGCPSRLSSCWNLIVWALNKTCTSVCIVPTVDKQASKITYLFNPYYIHNCNNWDSPQGNLVSLLQVNLCTCEGRSLDQHVRQVTCDFLKEINH